MQTYTVTVDEHGTIRWNKEGTYLLHRLGGPAVEYANGSKEYYVNGELHRLDGPACEYTSGTKSYYVEGEYYHKENFDKYIQQLNKPDPCNSKTVEIDGKKYKLSLVE